MRTLLSFLVIVSLAGCSDKPSSNVSGRTRSLSASYRESGASPHAALRLARSRSQATGAGKAELTAALSAEAEEVLLRLPGGSELPLESSSSGSWTARLEVPLEDAETALASGSYTLLWTERDGTRRSLTFIADAGFPDYPLISSPADMALVDPTALRPTWQWAGTAGLFDLGVRDAATETSTFEAHDVPGFDLSVPATLQGGARYRLEIGATSGPTSNAVRWTSTSTVVFDTTTS